ncbi:MAG: hypothetical protein AAFS03_09020 [Pseudomonadota bacterium]
MKEVEGGGFFEIGRYFAIKSEKVPFEDLRTPGCDHKSIRRRFLTASLVGLFEQIGVRPPL